MSYRHIYYLGLPNVNAILNYWDPFNTSLIVGANYDPTLNYDPLPKLAPDSGPPLAEDLALSTSYPNPFNPTVTISFNLSSAQYISVKVYNIMGQQIKELLNGRRNGGINTLIWDGTDNDGNPVSSGMYFCNIRTQDKQQTVKMTMLR